MPVQVLPLQERLILSITPISWLKAYAEMQR